MKPETEVKMWMCIGLYSFALTVALTVNWIIVNQAFEDVSNVKLPEFPNFGSRYKIRVFSEIYTCHGKKAKNILFKDKLTVSYSVI